MRWRELIQNKAFEAQFKECLFLRKHQGDYGAEHLIFAGLGSRSSEHEAWRQVGAAIYRTLVGNKIYKALFNLDHFKNLQADFFRGFIEGFGLADYRFDELKSKRRQDPEFELLITGKLLPDLQKMLHEAQIVFSAVNVARRLGDLPSNHLTPSKLALESQRLFKNTQAKVVVWDLARIKKERLGGLIAVSKGSAEEPRLIQIEYYGTKSNQPPLVLVGKGLTFDSGGISIKPSAGMEEMKFDMCGAAAVIGAVYAIVSAKLKINIIGIIGATENMPSGSATKPGDVYTARNGKTVEVNNTDAEGRLVLGECLVLASERKPQMILDVATLTGAIVVALGNTHTGYFTQSNELKTKIEKAAEASGEWVWHMPLCDYHTEDMKGTYADLNNISANKGAGSATAAAFLEQFVTENIRWAHFDIAGTAWAVGNRLNYCSAKGASGVMVRTFYELAKSVVD